MPEPSLDRNINYNWTNAHHTSQVGGPVEQLITPANAWQDGSQASKRFIPGLRGLQQIVREASQQHKRVRALGSAWSLSNAAYTDELLVNTQRLDYAFIGFNSANMVRAAYRDRRDRLMFVQCGWQIKSISAELEAKRLALPTSGASNGQTIAGAVSTGTHGAANQVGAMQAFVRGLHVVAEDGQHYWIERASNPVLTAVFCRWLDNARLLRDDNMFKAAVVGFGSFGIIHAVLLEAVPVYMLERHIRQYDYQDVVPVMNTLDISGLGLPEGSALPYHFEIVLNPYRTAPGEQGAYIRALYHHPAPDPLPPPDLQAGGLQPTEDLVAIIGHLAEVASEAIPHMLQVAMQRSLPLTPDEGVWGTHSQQFGDSEPVGGGISTEIGVPVARTQDAVEAIINVARAHRFATPVALRYVPALDAWLAFTCFDPMTCAIELPGLDIEPTRDGYRAIWQVLRDRGIPHTFHWGQAMPLTHEWVRAGFGDERVDQWLHARRAFLGDNGRHMFSNALLDQLGLAR